MCWRSGGEFGLGGRLMVGYHKSAPAQAEFPASLGVPRYWASRHLDVPTHRLDADTWGG